MKKAGRHLAECVVMLLVAVGTVAAADAPRTIVRTISHQLTASGRLTSIDLDDGDQVSFKIVDTDPACFTYNLSEVKSFATRDPGAPKVTEVVLGPVTHYDGVKAYAIDVQPRSVSCTGKAVHWTVPVRLGIRVGGGAGWTFGSSTQRQFFLRAGTKDGKAGYFIEEDRVDEADHQVAAFVQLINERWPNWNMLSVGTSATTERPQIYVGSGLRFANNGGLIAGISYGKRNRLPLGQKVGDFVEQDTPLGSLDERSFGFFVGLQLSVFPGAKETKPTETVKPAPAQ